MARGLRAFGSGAIGALVTLCLLGLPAQGATSAPSLQFRVLTRTGMPLADIVWTGSRFVYSLEGRSSLYSTDARGTGFRPFAAVPRNGGEMRCLASPASHGWPANTLYCHAAEGSIYRLSADGGPAARLAVIPSPHGSDGSLAFDTLGRFGYALLAATGGSDSGSGGDVYAIAPDGHQRHVGRYLGPGGAENIAIAPSGFGTAAGSLLITIDKHDHLGRLLAMDARGAVRTLVGGLAWGLNPLAPLTPSNAPAGAVAGLYTVDWLSHTVLFAPAGPLLPYLGNVFMGSERHGYMYVVVPRGSGYTALPIRTNLRARDYNLEGARFLSP